MEGQLFCPEVYTLIKLAATKSIDVSVWLTEENVNSTICEEEFIAKVKSLAMVASMEEIEEIKMEVDIAVNVESLETILCACSAGTNENGISMVNVSRFLDLCEYTRIPRSTFPESNDDDVDIKIDENGHNQTDDSIGISDEVKEMQQQQQYRPNSPDSLNGLGPGRELTVTMRSATNAVSINHSDDICSLNSSNSDRVPVSSSSAPLTPTEVVQTLPMTTNNSNGGTNGILNHPPSKHIRSASPSRPSTAAAMTMKPATTATAVATAPSSSSLKKATKVTEGNGKTTTPLLRSQRPASADPRIAMRSRIDAPTPTFTGTQQQQQQQQQQPQQQQKYLPSQEQHRRKSSPAVSHAVRPSSSSSATTYSTKDRASFGPVSTRAKARTDDVSDMEKFLGIGYGFTPSDDLPFYGTKLPSRGTKTSAHGAGLSAHHAGMHPSSMSMSAFIEPSSTSLSLRGPRDAYSPTRIERNNGESSQRKTAWSSSNHHSNYNNSNFNHSNNHLITASSSISSSGIHAHNRSRSYSTAATAAVSSASMVVMELTAQESRPFVEDSIRNAVRQADFYHLIQVQLGFSEGHTNVSAGRGGSVSVTTSKSPSLWLSTRDLQMAFFTARIRFNETQIMALGYLVEAFAIDHKTRASSVSTGTRARSVSTGTKASLALVPVQSDLTLVPRRRTHTFASDLAPAPMLSKHAFIPCRIRDKGLKITPCRINAQWLRMYLNHLRLTQRSSLAGGHPAGGVSSSASFPTKSISRSLSSGALTTRRSISGTGITTSIKVSEEGRVHGVSNGEHNIGGSNTGHNKNDDSNDNSNNDNNEKDHCGTDGELLSPASSSSSKMNGEEGKKRGGRGREGEKMGEEGAVGGRGGGGGGVLCRALKKALSGKPHHLSKDEMNRLLEGQIIVPEDVLKEEVAHRVRCWIFDMSGRREFAHTMSLKMREWEACQVADRKIRMSLDSTSAKASLGVDSTNSRASTRLGSGPSSTSLDADRAAAKVRIKEECVQQKTSEWQAAERTHAVITKDLYWKFDAFHRDNHYRHSLTWENWLIYHRKESQQQLELFIRNDKLRAKECANRVARKEYMTAVGDLEIKLMELNAYPPLREFGHDIRSNLSILKKVTTALGQGLGRTTGPGPGLAPGHQPGDTKDYHTLVITQDDFNRQLLSALVTAHAQGLFVHGPGLPRDRCPTLKDLPDNIRTLAKDLQRYYQRLLVKSGCLATDNSTEDQDDNNNNNNNDSNRKNNNKNIHNKRSNSNYKNANTSNNNNHSNNKNASEFAGEGMSHTSALRASMVVSVPSVMREEPTTTTTTTTVSSSSSSSSSSAVNTNGISNSSSIVEPNNVLSTLSPTVPTSEKSGEKKVEGTEAGGVAVSPSEPSPGSFYEATSNVSLELTTKVLSKDILAKEKVIEWKEKKKREIKEQLDRERAAKEQAEIEKAAKKSQGEKAYAKWLKLQKRNKYISLKDGSKHVKPPAVTTTHSSPWSRETDVKEMQSENDRRFFY